MTHAPPNAETTPSGLRWLMVGLIFLATVINYLCRQAYSVSATTLQRVFSLSNEDYGLLTSGFFLFDGKEQHHDVEKEWMFHGLGFAQGF